MKPPAHTPIPHGASCRPWDCNCGAKSANLYLAAPDLLAIVERIATGERIEACGEICETDPCLCCQARAAIAKARGTR